MKRFFIIALVSILLCISMTQLIWAAELQPEIEYSQKLLTESQVIIHRITLTRPGVFTLHLRHQETLPGKPWRVRLSDAHLQALFDIAVSGEELETDAPRLRLPAGGYDLRITVGEEFCEEILLLSYTFIDESDMSVEREPNGTVAMASLLEPDKFVLGNTQSRDDLDIFALDVDLPGLLVLQLEANRSADGQHWEVSIRQGNLEAQKLDLDPELHCTTGMRVVPGRYYIYVTASENSWSDADYRLIARLQRQPNVVPEVETLIVGTAAESRLTKDDRSCIFQFIFEGSELSEDSLVLRLQGREDELQELEFWLTGKDNIVLWQGRAAANAELYTVLISNLEPGEYQLTIHLIDESPLEEIFSGLGLFSPEMLPTIIAMQIDDTLMTVNGEPQEIDPGYATIPRIVEGRTLVPIRSLVETFGGAITWEAVSERIRIDCGGHVVDLQIGVADATVDGILVPLDVAPQLHGGRTLLPLRFVGEALGCFVRWQGEQQVITIWY